MTLIYGKFARALTFENLCQEMGSLRPPNSPSQGYWDVSRWFWYRFAYERGLEVQVLGSEGVYSIYVRAYILTLYSRCIRTYIRAGAQW